MDREQILGIVTLLGVLAVAGVGAWLASRYLGWTGTLALGTMAIGVFAVLLQRLGTAIFFVALTVVIVATGRLMDDGTRAGLWIALVMGGAGMVVGYRSDVAEAEARIGPYPYVPPGPDAGDGPA